LNTLKNYQSTKNLIEDSEQLRVVEKFSALESKLLSSKKTTFLNNLLKKQKKLKGIYLWGSVGRGKTFIMDTFFSSLEFKEKIRLHYHHLMRKVHKDLKTHKNKKNPIRLITNSISKGAKVICIDEFFVEDIADAMILSELLAGLIEKNVTLVITSNSHPQELYKKGLQRERFTKAIDLLVNNTAILNIGSGPDYRLKDNLMDIKFNSIHNEESDHSLKKFFHTKTPIGVSDNDFILINDRRIEIVIKAKTIIWFDFSQICGTARSIDDYIAIAREYQSVIISKVPILDDEKENEARRFISIIDEFYERKVKLVLTTDTCYKKLYQGKRLNFEFERTKSRLSEMSTLDYQKLPHKH